MSDPDSFCTLDAVADGNAPQSQDEVAKSEYWEIVRAALSPTQFAAVYLYFRESFTQEDIAERLGISQQHAARLIEKALGRLRKRAVAAKLERCIPSTRKPPVLQHNSLQKYVLDRGEDMREPEERYTGNYERRKKLGWLYDYGRTRMQPVEADL